MQFLGLIRIRREYKNERTAFRLRWAYTEKKIATPVARKATKLIYNAILAVQPLK